MSRRGVEHLQSELHAVIDRFRQEYELTYAEAVGCIEIVKSQLIAECIKDDDEGEEFGV